MNEASVMFVGRVVTKSSAVSVSSLPVLAVRERVAIWPSGLPVLKKNGIADGWKRGSSSSQRTDRPRERRTRVGRCEEARQSETNMVGLLERERGAGGAPECGPGTGACSLSPRDRCPPQLVPSHLEARSGHDLSRFVPADAFTA